jgi:predicted small secreted protein
MEKAMKKFKRMTIPIGVALVASLALVGCNTAIPLGANGGDITRLRDRIGSLEVSRNTDQARLTVVETNAISNTRLDADLLPVATNKPVFSCTGSKLAVDYGATTNGGTVTWSKIFAGTPCAVATYWGSGTNSIGKKPSAQVTSCNATNCAVAGDDVDVAAFIYVIGVGVGPD